MDRPLGPRPDKRNAAYESIFGRPSAIHHRPPPPSSLSYSQSFRQPQDYNAQQIYYQQQYQPQQDRRASIAPSVRSQYSQSPQPGPPSAYRQSYYPPQQPPQPQQPIYDGYSQQGYGHLAAPQQHYPSSIASSSHSHSHSAGVIAPQPLNDPDASLEPHMQSGMTPAQAYQAQIYSNNPMAQDERNHSPSRGLFGPRDPNPPRLGVDVVDARLDLDFEFGGDDSGPGSNPGTEEGSSDLPYRSTPNTSVQNHRDSGLSDVSSDYHQNAAGPSSRPYPLQLDTALTSKASTALNNSPASSTYVEQMGSSATSGNSARRSSESTRTMPRPLVLRRERTVQDRSRSMSAMTSQAHSMLHDLKIYSPSPLPPLPTEHGSPGSPALNASTRRTPIVYPALLSRVAEAFRVRMTLTERVKDGLEYTDAFDGREAVDKLAYIIKTTDRNLALLLGRALDAQKFFHDVTYDHRLRDSPNELYQFRTKIPSPFVSGEQAQAGSGGGGGNGNQNGESAVDGGTPPERPAMEAHLSSGDTAQQVGADGTPQPFPTTRPRSGSASSDEVPLPSGVFTLLTDCYSPTCSRDSLCYSIACPRRLEQQARLNMKPQPGLKRRISQEVYLGDLMEPGSLWVHSVPKEIVDSVSETEKKRQEAINEVMYTERDFVRDMEYLRDVWIAPLKKSDIIPEERRLDFLEQVFWNIHDIIAVNTRLRDALNKRQKSYAVVERIGDILLEVVPHFAPFVSYGSHQLYGKYEFEKEKSANAAFQKFVDETERLPESRKLELNGYLTKPTTRLAKYPLLFDVILKYTPDDNPDKEDLIKVVAIVRDFLNKVNVESGRTENRFNLLQLDQQLVFRPGEEVDLRLREEGRELVYKGNLKRRGGGGQGDSGDLQLFLFDHALLMVKQKAKHEQYKVYRRPIPLELLLISAPDETTTGRQGGKAQLKTLTKRNSFGKSNASPTPPAPPAKASAKDGFSITFVHLGRKYYQITLWASTHVGRRKWVENITRQQEIMRERSLIFDTVTLSEGFFHGVNRVNCAAPFNGGRRIAYGTNDGVYFTLPREPHREPVKVLALLDVTQVDILEEYQLLIVLSEHQVITFPLDALSEHDPMAGLRRAKRIASHTSFFKAGTCLGKTLVCVVKASQLSSTIKALEPIEYTVRGKNKPTFRKLLQGGHDTLRPFREFYIPVESSSIHYLKTKLCVGCTKGFEIVDLETLDTQALLDPSDTSLDFVQKREDVRPMAIYRIENDFLLCYDDFAFYVNKNGWRARPKFMVHWEGHPRAFALHYPYVLAFEPTFVEVRHVETGSMSQIIQGNNLRCLFADTPPSTTIAPANFAGGNYPQGYRPDSVYGRNSMSSQHSVPPSYHSAAPAYFNPYQRHQAYGRDEIMVVSDDRVMALQMIAPAFSQDGVPFTSH